MSEFFKKYPKSWMFYGYGMKPDINVASRIKSAGPARPRTMCVLHQAQIATLKLRHKGKKYTRNLSVEARWYDPAAKKLVSPLASKKI